MIPCTEKTYCLICLLRLSEDIEDEIKLGGRGQVAQLLCKGCGYRDIQSQYLRNEFKCGHATCILGRCCAGPGQLVRASFVLRQDDTFRQSLEEIWQTTTFIQWTSYSLDTKTALQMHSSVVLLEALCIFQKSRDAYSDNSKTMLELRLLSVVGTLNHENSNTK